MLEFYKIFPQNYDIILLIIKIHLNRKLVKIHQERFNDSSGNIK